MSEQPPVGALVLTPTGRIARVTGYDSEGRADLRYQHGVCANELGTCPAALLKPYDPTPRPLHRPKP